MTLVVRTLKLFFLFLFCLSFLACTKKEKLYELQGNTMGTSYSIKFISKQKPHLPDLRKKIEAELDEVNRQMSTYRVDSEISQVNRSKSGRLNKISPWFAAVLEDSFLLSKKTKGYFDPTIGPLVNRWGFGPQSRKEIPSNTEIKEIKEYVGYEKIALNKTKEGFFVTKAHNKLYLDLSASAKGFGVDLLSKTLSKMGYENHLVEIGGELRASGSKYGKDWRVAIEKADESKRSYQKIIPLRNLSIATSGSYRNFYSSNGKKYNHTINPQTGKPTIHNLISASVLDEDCMKADGYATALMVLGTEKAINLIKSEGLAAYLIFEEIENSEKKVKTFTSKKFNQLTRQL